MAGRPAPYRQNHFSNRLSMAADKYNELVVKKAAS
jgi:hypothetical protein